MRILQVNSARSLGGGETHVLELVQHLRTLGHDVSVAGRSIGPMNPDIALPFLNSADFVSALKLRKALKKERFDVVHAHVARDYTVVAAAAWRVPATRVVFTRHLLYPVKKHALYRRVDGWLSPTSQILATLGHMKPKRSAVIPNWVDAAKFEFRPHDLHQPVNIGLLGQISPHKGHDDAVEAIRSLGAGYRLLIAGKGDPDYANALMRRAAGLPVDFLGFVSLPDFFDMIDVLIVPSWEEPFGIVLLEAMATGVPVIATACGGPLDIIQTEAHGLLVPPRDAAELAAAIERLARDTSLRLRVIQQARARVVDDFDIRKVVPRIETFYRSLIVQTATP